VAKYSGLFMPLLICSSLSNIPTYLYIAFFNGASFVAALLPDTQDILLAQRLIHWSGMLAAPLLRLMLKNYSLSLAESLFLCSGHVAFFSALTSVIRFWGLIGLAACVAVLVAIICVCLCFMAQEDRTWRPQLRANTVFTVQAILLGTLLTLPVTSTFTTPGAMSEPHYYITPQEDLEEDLGRDEFLLAQGRGNKSGDTHGGLNGAVDMNRMQKIANGHDCHDLAGNTMSIAASSGFKGTGK
jgi:hypothetical protein